MDKRDLIVERVLASIHEYTEAFKAPCPMRVLSQRHARSLNEFGGFVDTMEELAKLKRIRVWLSRSGAKSVTLASSDLTVEGSVEV